MCRRLAHWLIAVALCAAMQFGLNYALGFNHWNDAVFWKASTVFILVLSLPATAAVQGMHEAWLDWVKLCRRSVRWDTRLKKKYRTTR